MARVNIKRVFKTKKIYLHRDFYLSFGVFKMFVFMCRHKTNIGSQIDLVCKQSLDETQTEMTGNENREKHIRLRQSKMRHVVLKAVSMKLIFSGIRPIVVCCLLTV